MKTFYLKTLGCKVNQSDSNEIRERFFKSGWVQSNGDAKADVYIVNTCCVTHHADRKSRAAIRYALKNSGNASVCVTGCYAGYNREALEDIGGIDAVFENDKRDKLFDWIDGLTAQSQVKIEKGSGLERADNTRAFLKIQDGCDNRCSFCVVPFVRGRSRSKDISSVIEEARSFVETGFKEIVLTGVNLGSFGRDLTGVSDIVGVISELEGIKGLARIRLSSVEASDITDTLIDKMAASKKLCPHLHIPFQSGDDQVLGLMNKRSKTKDYLTIVEKAKKKINDLAITCDLIVGFPSETEENFANTLEFIKSITPSRAHIFTYSRRMNKPFAGNEDETPIPELTIKERFRRLKALTDRFSLDFKKSYLNKRLSVLFEEKKAGFWQGYSQNYIRVCVASDLPLKNTIRTVKVVDLRGDFCLGQIQAE